MRPKAFYERMRGHDITLLASFLIVAGGALFVSRGAGRRVAAGYHVVKKIALGGEGGWDYFSVDSATHRIFIPRETHTETWGYLRSKNSAIGLCSGLTTLTIMLPSAPRL